MNCRKCCEIVASDERCLMCGAQQRIKHRHSKGFLAGSSELVEEGLTSKKRISIAKIIGMVNIIGTAFLMFGCGPSFSAPTTPSLWDFGLNDIILINQVNRNVLLSYTIQTFMDEDAIYMMTSDRRIIRTTDNFENYVVIANPAPTMFSFQMTDGGIYYTTQASENRSIFALYHYNLATGEPTRITENVTSEFIINNLVFHKRAEPVSNLYVFDMETGESSLLVNRRIRDFVVDYENELLFFIERGQGLYQADIDGANQERLHERVRSFAFNGETVAFSTLDGGLYTLNLETGESQYVYNNNLTDLVFVGQYIVAKTMRDHYLYLIDLEDLNNDWLIAEDMSVFASTGNYIIYHKWDEDSINRMDLLGQSEFIHPRWHRQD